MDWVKAGNVSCDICCELYDDDPPCRDCKRPDELSGTNLMCWRLWKQLSHRDRPAGMGGLRPIPTAAIGNMCEIYNLTLTEFERISLIENEMYEWLYDQLKDQSEVKDGRVTDTSRNKTGTKEPERPNQRFQKGRYSKR